MTQAERDRLAVLKKATRQPENKSSSRVSKTSVFETAGRQSHQACKPA
ncbi:MAG: hypothetical protein ACR2NN_09850 [Bryobacteraceae bacterium]